MINNGLAGSLEKSSQGIDRIDKGDIGAGIKECVRKNDSIIQAEMDRKLEEQKGIERIKEDNRKNLDSLVDGIRGDMGR